jgi:dolichyl-phosphate beta-glucosyltransferase
VRVTRNPHRGKGHAVKTGMLEARGTYAAFCDADLAVPMEEIHKLLRALEGGSLIAIGSREAKGAMRHGEPIYRHLMGRVFNQMVSRLTVRGFSDTQCGFKCFHRSIIPSLFGNQTVDGFSFDVEILFIAAKRGYPVVEVPVSWYYSPESKVHPLRDSIRMFRELLQVRRNDRRGVYGARGVIETTSAGALRSR